MALSRAEIELIVKARNEAGAAFDQLSKQVSAVTGEAQKTNTQFEGLKKKTNENAVAAGAAGVAFGLLAERLGRGLVSAFQETIAAANRLDAGLIGLKSVATAFKQDAGQAEDAAKRLAQDGLLSVGEAATSLKNLLAAGFGLPEAVQLVDRFKDSAAFGRQSALGFGQAVASATEGIKNGNSIQADNAGVTKNLSQILVEAGFSAQDLSKASGDANIRLALFNGIIKETNPQLGDAARYLDTAAGKQAQFSSQVEIAQQKIGKALQPALAAVLETLVPLVQAVGNFAGVLAPLGLAVGTVVGPMVALRAAASVGIIELGTFTKTMATLKAAATADVVAGIGGALRGLPALASSAGSAVAGIPALIAAAPWAALAVAIGGVTLAVKKLMETRANAAVAAETEGAKQDVINRAIAQGAPLVVSYTGAIAYNQAVLDARTKSLDNSTAALRRKADAQLKVGDITKAEYDATILAIQGEERRAAGLANGKALRDAVTGSEAKFREEIAATGLTMGQLLQALGKDEDAFKKWAESVKLSDSTVDKLKDRLKATEDQTKKNEKATKEAAEAQKQFAKEMEQATGIISQGGLNEELAKLERFLTVAATQGTPALQTAVRNLYPEFEKLTAQAKASGLAIGNITGVMQQAVQGANLLTVGVRNFTSYTPLIAGVTEAHKVNTAEVRVAYQEQDKLNAAYKAFGIQTPADLKAAADAAQQNYAVLAASGQATTAQLKNAYKQMIDAQKAATGQLPTYWETNVAPAVKRTVEVLGTAIQGTFAQILLGAKGLGDGFKDIWESIKGAATKVFTEILADFTNRFLKGLLGALSGQQGAFSSAFGRLFGGGGGGVPGVAGGGFNLGGLFGGGGGAVGLTGAGSSSSIAAAGLGLPGGGGAAGAGGLGIGAAGVAGGLGAAGAGFGLGKLSQQLFGGAGFGAASTGGLSGAATGALIGSIVPGLGTAIGAIIGGLGGVLGGALGKSQGEKTNDARDKFFANFGGGGTGEGSGFLTVAQELSKLSAAAGGGEGGGTLFQKLIKADNLKELEAAIKNVIAALQEQETATAAAGEATADAAAEGASEAADLEQRWQDQVQTVQRLKAEAGQLEQSFGDVANQEGGVVALNRAMAALKEQITQAEAAAGDLASAMASIPGAPVSSGSTEVPIVEGGAAGGVFANRPGLVLFGEGGEQEVGGPRSFFKQVFEELGVGASGGGPVAGGGGVTLNVTINALDGASVRDVFFNQIVPMLKDALRSNTASLQTDVRAILR